MLKDLYELHDSRINMSHRTCACRNKFFNKYTIYESRRVLFVGNELLKNSLMESLIMKKYYGYCQFHFGAFSSLFSVHAQLKNLIRKFILTLF